MTDNWYWKLSARWQLEMTLYAMHTQRHLGRERAECIWIVEKRNVIQVVKFTSVQPTISRWISIERSRRRRLHLPDYVTWGIDFVARDNFNVHQSKKCWRLEERFQSQKEKRVRVINCITFITYMFLSFAYIPLWRRQKTAKRVASDDDAFRCHDLHSTAELIRLRKLREIITFSHKSAYNLNARFGVT